MTRNSTPVGRPDIVERADVRMRKRGDRARFALEANTRTLVVKQTWRDYFDGNNAAEPRVARAIDLAHPTGAQRAKDLVRPEPDPCDERHTVKT